MAVIGRQEIRDRVTVAVNASKAQAQRAFGGRPAVVPSRAAPFVEGLFVVIFGVLVVKIFLSLLAPLPLPEGDAAAAMQSPEDAAPLVVKSPFPAAPLEVAVIADDAPDVAETTLDLTLNGVWVEADGGSAVIKTPDGKQKRFEVGDEIVSGVTLDGVFADQVTIRRGGVREALRFESKFSAPYDRPAPQPTSPEPEPASKIMNIPIGGITSIFRVAPATGDDGKIVLELFAGKNRAAFAATGLRNGDRLVSIDGAPAPASPAAISAFISSLQKKSEAEIIIRRDGRDIPVTISLDRLGEQ